MSEKGKLVIITAPSGTGKTTICEALLKRLPEFTRIITYTTRAPRENEVDGVDYHFVVEGKFKQMLANGEFAEHAEVYGKFYGNRSSDIQENLAAGKNLLFNIDVQGAKTFKKKFPECFTIFILPPSLEVLRKRLEHRNTDTKATIEKRLSNARKEIDQASSFDFQVVNDDLEKTVCEIATRIKK